MSSTFYVCCIFQVYFRLDIIMKANTMNPDQTEKVNQFCHEIVVCFSPAAIFKSASD